MKQSQSRLSRLAKWNAGVCLAAMCHAAGWEPVVPANAAEPQAWASAFRWEAPAECPPQRDVLERLSAVLSSDGFEQKPLDLGETRIFGSIQRAGPAWVLDLDVTDARGRRTRRLQAERCDELAQAAALALALLLEEKWEDAVPHDAPAAGIEPEEAPEMKPPALAVSARSADAKDSLGTPAPEASPADSEALGIRLALGADAILDSSTLADASFGAGLRAQLGAGRFGAGVHAVFLPARKEELGEGESVELGLFAAGVRLCGTLAEGTWGAEICAGGEAGWVSAKGIGLIAPEQGDGAWLAPSLGLVGRWHGLAEGAVASRFELLLPLLRRDYVINRSEVIHETPSWTLRWSLGVELDVL